MQHSKWFGDTYKYTITLIRYTIYLPLWLRIYVLVSVKKCRRYTNVAFLNFANFLVKIGFANIVLMKFYLWRWNATVGNIFLVWACNELPLRRLWGVVKNVWLKCALFLSKMFQWNWFIFFKQQRSNINPFSKRFTSKEI